MGYNTNYSLTSLGPTKSITVTRALRLLESLPVLGYQTPCLEKQAVIEAFEGTRFQIQDAYDVLGKDYFEDDCSWYDHEKDMCQMSSRFSGVLFRLEGKGEEQGDHWIKYFKNGKMQTCKAQVSFEEYDETKLT